MRKVTHHLDPKITIQKNDAILFLQSLHDESVDLIATDPAYSGMNQHLMLGKGRIVGTYKDKGKKDAKWFGEFHDTPENYSVFLDECSRVLKPNNHIFIMFDSYSLISLAPIVREKFEVKNLITWDKVHFGMGHYFRRQSEQIIFASKGKKPITSRAIPDVWKFRRIKPALYPTQKPVEVFRAMIASSIEPNSDAVVVDPFMGSGSCAVAALQHGVKFIGCDVSNEAIEATKARIKSIKKNEPDPFQKKSSIPDGFKIWW